MDKETIKSILLAHGFTIKQGEADLKPYVYSAASAIYEAALQAAQPKWQPIETAPDREYILILVDGQITGVGSTYLGDWWASMPNGEVCELNEPPTHWMPLPEAP